VETFFRKSLPPPALAALFIIFFSWARKSLMDADHLADAVLNAVAFRFRFRDRVLVLRFPAPIKGKEEEIDDIPPLVDSDAED
jgi:hypothetical protein